MKAIFTKERIIYAIIISIFGFLGTVYTARIQASSKTDDALSEFKLDTTKEIGGIKTKVEVLEALNPEINRRLKNIEGNIQTLTSLELRRTR